MRKSIAATAALVMAVSCLAGCGMSEEEKAARAEQDAKAAVLQEEQDTGMKRLTSENLEGAELVVLSFVNGIKNEDTQAIADAVGAPNIFPDNYSYSWMLTNNYENLKDTDLNDIKVKTEKQGNSVSMEVLVNGSIVVDGRLIHSKYTEKDGEIYLNLVDVASATDSSIHYSEEKGYVAVRPNEFVTVQVPTNAANASQNKVFHVSGGKFTFSSWAGDSFSIDNIPVLDYDTTLISAENVSRMFGWRMYTDGDVLSIVSDPLNVTNKTVVYTSDSMGLTSVLEKDEFGNEVVNTYDSNGTLTSSKPFNGVLDDEPAAESGMSIENESSDEMVGEEN